jgi:drug/metabolite transporter (DMT)-like permease
MLWFVFATLSALMASLSTIIEKRTLKDVHATDFSFIIAGLVAALSLPLLWLAPSFPLTPLILGTIYGTSILASFAYLEVTKGVRHMEISSSAPLFLLSPFITALFAFIALDESLSQGQLLGMGLLAVGTYILETTHLSDVKEFVRHFFGDHYARLIVLGLCVYALTSTVDRIILGSWEVPVMLYLALIHLCIFINFFFYALWKKQDLRALLSLTRRHIGSLSLVAVLSVGHRLAYAEAIASAAVALVVSVKRSSSLFTTIIGGQLFHDSALMRKSIACTIMFAGVALLALS